MMFKKDDIDSDIQIISVKIKRAIFKSFAVNAMRKLNETLSIARKAREVNFMRFNCFTSEQNFKFTTSLRFSQLSHQIKSYQLFQVTSITTIRCQDSKK